MKKPTYLFLLVIILLGSCVTRIADFTILSTKNIDISRMSSFERGKTRVEGEDKIHLIVLFPAGSSDVENAVDKAIESVPGCVALLDGVVSSKFWWIPYLYGQHVYIIEGTPLIDPTLVDNAIEIPTYGRVILDNDTGKTLVDSISLTEYETEKSKIVKDSKLERFRNSNQLN